MPLWPQFGHLPPHALGRDRGRQGDEGHTGALVDMRHRGLGDDAVALIHEHQFGRNDRRGVIAVHVPETGNERRPAEIEVDEGVGSFGV